MFSFDNIKAFAAIAHSHDACDRELDIINGLNNIEDVLTHPNAPFWACWYAMHVIKGRWTSAEPVIMFSSRWAYVYAKNVVKARWTEAEPVIMTSPKYACLYAMYVIKGHWAEAEAML